MQKVDENTTFTDRISVAADNDGEALTIVDVRLLDEREFFCQVNGLEAGSEEGRTYLKVFGKSLAFILEGACTVASLQEGSGFDPLFFIIMNSFSSQHFWFVLQSHRRLQ